MAAFSFRQHQDFLTYFRRLNQLGHTMDDVEAYVESQRNALNETPGRPGPQIKCPECNAPMMLLPVNDKPSTRTGDDSKTVMICSKKACMHTEYSTKTVREIIKELSQKQGVK